MAGKRPDVDSSDAICSDLVDIMWLIGINLTCGNSAAPGLSDLPSGRLSFCS